LVLAVVARATVALVSVEGRTAMGIVVKVDGHTDPTGSCAGPVPP
jgi:hypothetical protein